MARPDPAAEASSQIREFADAHHFRSATVDELVLDGDFYRRPLRPEDLAGIDFGTAVQPATFCDLPSLAAQRLLRCVHDQAFAWIPAPGDGTVFDRRAQFHSGPARQLAATIQPFLENFAFGFLESEHALRPGDALPARLQAGFAEIAHATRAAAQLLQQQFAAQVLTREDLGFLLVQRWCLDGTRQATLAKAQACGYFGALPAKDRPCPGLDPEGVLAGIAQALDLRSEPHAHWQFYLPGTLASLNHLSMLACQPEKALGLIAASLVQELEDSCFTATVSQAAKLHGWQTGARPHDLDGSIEQVLQRFGRAVQAIERQHGSLGLEELARSLRGAARLSELARRDLEAQLRWMCAIDQYHELAAKLDQRIQSQRPDIDRETFVEPREMCSTTHVHNDHRLVVIESGDMVFWARPGMRLRMAPGDMVLIPHGRLHGSSVESSVCVYHQPIIPEDWVRPLIREVDSRHGWPAMASAPGMERP